MAEEKLYNFLYRPQKYARQVNTTLCVRAKKSLKIFYAVRLIKNGTGRAED